MQCKLLNNKEVCQLTGKSRTTIWRWGRDGHFPAPIQIGPNSVCWTADQIDNWLAEKTGERLS